MSKKINENAVNEALQLPLSDRFEADLEALLYADDAQSGNPIIVALLDLDQFDRVNVNFGHDVGDRTLIAIGQHIAANVPECGRIYRVGGDEFFILMKNIPSLSIVQSKAALLLSSIQNLCSQYLSVSLSASIGISIRLKREDTLNSLYEQADQALYHAKRNGRNQAIFADEID